MPQCPDAKIAIVALIAFGAWPFVGLPPRVLALAPQTAQSENKRPGHSSQDGLVIASHQHITLNDEMASIVANAPLTMS
jgi:hypothetical protein